MFEKECVSLNKTRKVVTPARIEKPLFIFKKSVPMLSNLSNGKSSRNNISSFGQRSRVTLLENTDSSRAPTSTTRSFYKKRSSKVINFDKIIKSIQNIVNGWSHRHRISTNVKYIIITYLFKWLPCILHSKTSLLGLGTVACLLGQISKYITA